MNFELNAPNHLISLASSAIVVSVDIKTWTATKQDKSISNEVTTSKNADADAARVTKVLLSHSPEHKALLNYRQTVYNWLQRETYDWAGSMRLLPTYKLESFKKQFNDHMTAFDALLDKFVDAYPGLISDAAFKQGGMFNRSEYPEVLDVRRRFSMKLFTHSVPQNDFRCSISQVLADDLKEHYEAQTNEIVSGVMADLTKRLTTYATRLRNACEEVQAEANEEAKSGKTKRRKIYESTFDNVRGMVDMIRNFNLTNDSDLAEVADKLENILNTRSLTDLRDSAVARADTRDDLNDILSKFAPITLTTEGDSDE